MTAYRAWFTLRARHGCHGDAAAPVTVAPDAPTARRAARERMVIRAGEGWIEIARPQDAADDGGGPLGFEVIARDRLLIAGTQGLLGSPQRRFALTLAPDRPEAVAGPADLIDAPDRPGAGALLATVALDAGTGADFAVTFPAAAMPWIYVVTGAAADARLGVADARGEVAFSDAGRRRLPNGVEALLLRSDAPIALSARPAARFALMREGPFGSLVAAPALPAPALGALCLADGVVCAEIHVNL